MWILTYEVNDYDQYGEYFLAAWPFKPSKEKLEKVLKEDGSDYSVDEVYENSGRIRPTQSNDRWYNFFEYKNP